MKKNVNSKIEYSYILKTGSCFPTAMAIVNANETGSSMLAVCRVCLCGIEWLSQQTFMAH